MVSNPPVEVLYDDNHDRALVNLTAVGNSHIETVGSSPPRYKLDEWALRQLASQAEQAADHLAEQTD